MNLLDVDALRALIVEEVRRELAARPHFTNSVATDQSAGHLWTADNVAAYLQASRSWVYQQSEAGRIPCLKVVGLLRFDPAAVRAFAEGHPERATNVTPIRGKGR